MSKVAEPFSHKNGTLPEATFRECLQVRPNDGPSQVLIERTQMLREHPPGKDWNGTWQLVEK
jgi:hypothetical protein